MKVTEDAAMPHARDHRQMPLKTNPILDCPNYGHLHVGRADHVGGNAEVRAIVFPEPGQVRSRKVVSRSNARSAGKYPSWKMKRMLHWESSNELNAFRLLDCDPDVTTFNEQPCQVVYVVGGVERIHYPDILVATTGGKELWKLSSDPRLWNLRSLRGLLAFRVPFPDGATATGLYWARTSPDSHASTTQISFLALVAERLRIASGKTSDGLVLRRVS